MKFIESFEKEAVISLPEYAAKRVGQAAGSVVGTIRRGGKATRSVLSRGGSLLGKGFSESAHAPRINPTTGSVKPDIGTTLGGKKIEKATMAEHAAVKARAAGKNVDIHPVQTGDKERARGEARQRITERMKKSKQGPSFASKHPYVTAGGAFLAGKEIFAPKKEDPERPAVLYPGT